MSKKKHELEPAVASRLVHQVLACLRVEEQALLPQLGLVPACVRPDPIRRTRSVGRHANPTASRAGVLLPHCHAEGCRWCCRPHLSISSMRLRSCAISSARPLSSPAALTAVRRPFHHSSSVCIASSSFHAGRRCTARSCASLPRKLSTACDQPWTQHHTSRQPSAYRA
jgi:hypothetical protein